MSYAELLAASTDDLGYSNYDMHLSNSSPSCIDHVQ